MVNSDPLAEYEIVPNLIDADVSLETGVLSSEYSSSAILTSILRYGFLRFNFLSSELGT
jgi:hypothetical protein